MLKLGELVSVIVPVYKSEKYLDACITSLLNQTYHNIEIILVEDNSPDKSLEVCKRYVELDSRVRLIEHEKNTGCCRGRNDGCDAALGAWVMFLDADDEYSPDAVEIMVGSAQKYEADAVISTFTNVDYDGTRRVQYCDAEPGVYSSEEIAGLCLSKLTWEIISYPCSKIYRKSFLDQYSIRHSQYHDSTFVIEVLSKAKRVGVVASSTAFYYRRNSSLSRSFRPSFYDYYHKTDEELFDYLYENGALSEQRKYLLTRKQLNTVKEAINNPIKYMGYKEYSTLFDYLREKREVQALYSEKWALSDYKGTILLLSLQHGWRTMLFLMKKFKYVIIAHA